MNGIVNVLKPPGMSSHQVVSFMRKQLRTKKVGHAGTLDPGASGVLPLMIGNATKLSNYLMNDQKTYVVEVTLGISTTSQDASGETSEIKTDFSISRQLRMPWLRFMVDHQTHLASDQRRRAETVSVGAAGDNDSP